MRRYLLAASVAVPAVFVLTACSDRTSPTETARVARVAPALDVQAKHAGGIVARDACEPNSFNTLGDGTCVNPGNVTLDEFVSELGATHVVKHWNLTPGQLTARLGVDLLGNNVGGEVHTFTPVKEFGGGFHDLLNQLSDNPVAAPECLTLDDDDKVPAGGKYLIEKEELAGVVDASGIARVQCCVHPWMRAEVRMQHAVVN